MQRQLQTAEKWHAHLKVVLLFGLWFTLFQIAHTPYRFTMDLLNYFVIALLWGLPAVVLYEIWNSTSRLLFKCLESVICLVLLFAIVFGSALVNADNPLMGNSSAGERIPVDSENSIEWREFSTDLFNQGVYAEQLEQFKQVFPGIEHRYVLKKVNCKGVTVTSKNANQVVFHTNEEPGVNYVVPLIK